MRRILFVPDEAVGFAIVNVFRWRGDTSASGLVENALSRQAMILVATSSAYKEVCNVSSKISEYVHRCFRLVGGAVKGSEKSPTRSQSDPDVSTSQPAFFNLIANSCRFEASPDVIFTICRPYVSLNGLTWPI